MWGCVQKSGKLFGGLEKNDYLCPRLEKTSLQVESMRQKNQEKRQIEVLAFHKGLQQATVVTDGKAVRSFTNDEVRGHQSTRAAIAHLEALGYSLNYDQLW